MAQSVQQWLDENPRDLVLAPPTKRQLQELENAFYDTDAAVRNNPGTVRNRTRMHARENLKRARLAASRSYPNQTSQAWFDANPEGNPQSTAPDHKQVVDRMAMADIAGIKYRHTPTNENKKIWEQTKTDANRIRAAWHKDRDQKKNKLAPLDIEDTDDNTEDSPGYAAYDREQLR